MALNGGIALNGDVPDLDPRQVERLLQIAAAMSEAQEKATGNPKLDMAGLMAALAMAEKEDVMGAGAILNGGGGNLNKGMGAGGISNGGGGNLNRGNGAGGIPNGGGGNLNRVTGAGGIPNGGQNTGEALAGAKVANGGVKNRYQTQNSFLHSNFSNSSSSSSSTTTTDNSRSYSSSNINTTKNIETYSESTTIRKESYESKETAVIGQMASNNQNNSAEHGQINNAKNASFLHPHGNVGGRVVNAATSPGANVRNKKAMFESSSAGSASNSSVASSEPSPIITNKFNNKGPNKEKKTESQFSSIHSSSEEVNIEARKNEITTSAASFQNGSLKNKDHDSRVLKEYGSGAVLFNGTYEKQSNGTTNRPMVPPPAPPSNGNIVVKIPPNAINKLDFSRPTSPPPPPLPTTEPPKQDTANYREQFRMKTEAFESKPKRLGPKPFPGTAKYKLAEPANPAREEDNAGNAYTARLGTVSHAQDTLFRQAQEPNFQTEKSSLIHELKSKIDGEPEMEKPKPSGLRKDMGINPQQSKALTNLLMQINSGGEINNSVKAPNGGPAKFAGVNQSGGGKKVVSGGRTEEENNALMKKLVYTQYREMLKSYNNESK